MKVLLVYPNIRHESLVPPSIALFSRILKNEGIEVKLFDSTDYNIELDRVDVDRVKQDNLQVIPCKSIERISKGDVFNGFKSMVLEFKPDLIAMTCTESTFLLGVSFLRFLRENEREHIPTVLGGVFATFASSLALRYPEIDMVALGEGEHTLAELCRAMERGDDYKRIVGIWAKDANGTVIKNPFPAVVDINKNPTDLDIGMFDEHRLYRPMAGTMFRMLSVETHRGCPYNCNFCNSPAQRELHMREGAGSFFRKKSIEKVREEILFYKNNFGINYVFFWADTFFAYTKEEFDDFIEMYKEIKLPFWCQTRPETVIADRDRIRQLREIGLHFLSFGLEHGNEKFRSEVIGRKMSNDTLRQAFKITEESGVPFNVNNIIGFPGETRELVFDTIELNREISAASMSCSIFMPYHGTVLHRLAVAQGYISDDTICPSNNDEAIMNMSSMGRDEIMGLSRTFVLYARFPKSRWPEIHLAEAPTDEGRGILKRLRQEYTETYMPKQSILRDV